MFSVDLISRENEPSYGPSTAEQHKKKKHISPIIIKFIQMSQADFMTLENVRNTKLTAHEKQKKKKVSRRSREGKNKN